jgi:hypothetical protein
VAIASNEFDNLVAVEKWITGVKVIKLFFPSSPTVWWGFVWRHDTQHNVIQ